MLICAIVIKTLSTPISVFFILHSSRFFIYTFTVIVVVRHTPLGVAWIFHLEIKNQ